jgi:hypothetical protein
MLPERKNKTNIGVGLGIILEITGRLIAAMSPGAVFVGLLVVLIGAAFFIWGA